MFMLRTGLVLFLIAGCARHRSSEGEGLEANAARHPYTHPLSTPGARFGSLPQNVQTTVLSEAGTAEIADVEKETVGDRVIYRIFFKESATFPPLIVGSDGSVLDSDLKVVVPFRQLVTGNVKVTDLPLSVAKVLQEHAPNAEIASITKENWGDHTVYTIIFKDEVKYPKLQVVADGTVLHKS
jgi:hypothetical protein